MTCTFCSTVVSFATTTFWVWLFGKFVLESERQLSLPYLQLFISLISLVVPIFIGMFITYKRPNWSVKLVKLSRPFFILMMLLVSTLGIYINRFFFTVVSLEELVAPACLGAVWSISMSRTFPRNCYGVSYAIKNLAPLLAPRWFFMA